MVEQNLQVFPTLSLAASPLFSVNSESREVARSFYPVRLEVYRACLGDETPEEEEEEDDEKKMMIEAGARMGARGLVYLSPARDVLVSVYGRAALHDSELTLERSERSKMTAWLHRTRPMSEETGRLFRRHPDRWCLTRYASAHLSVQDWVEVREWMLAFGEEEYRGARNFLRSMHINTAGFAQVFGWE